MPKTLRLGFLLAIPALHVACDGRRYSLGRPQHAHQEAGNGGDDTGVGGTTGVGGVLGGTGGAGTSASGQGGAISRGGSSSSDAGSGGSGVSGDSGEGGEAGTPDCGDGVTQPPEECDDGNHRAGDGCSAACRFEPVFITTRCAVSSGGTVKCWGNNWHGALGLGDIENRGDEPGEMGDSLPAIELGAGRRATRVSNGQHTCALLDQGSLKCWGYNYPGILGLGDLENRGDEPGEMGDNLPAVELGTGRRVMSVASGGQDTCVILDDGSVKCWGYNTYGQLGLGDMLERGYGPGQMGDDLPAVDLGTGRRPIGLAVGILHACAWFDDGSVKCWGQNHFGALGNGDAKWRGDEPGEMGDDLPTVALGAERRAMKVVAYASNTCALLDDGSVKCWGINEHGGLGLGDRENRGDEPGEMGDDLPKVDLGSGRRATDIAVGTELTCALLDDGSVKCWGYNYAGQLGRGDTEDRGDEPGEMGDDLPPVDLGRGHFAVGIAATGGVACALLDDHSVKCWGTNFDGRLGLGDTEDRGDEPGEMGDNLPAVDLVF